MIVYDAQKIRVGELFPVGIILKHGNKRGINRTNEYYFTPNATESAHWQALHMNHVGNETSLTWKKSVFIFMVDRAMQ